jgi:hypothetical protein
MLSVHQPEIETSPESAEDRAWEVKEKRRLRHTEQKGTSHLEILYIINCIEDRAQGYQ